MTSYSFTDAFIQNGLQLFQEQLSVSLAGTHVSHCGGIELRSLPARARVLATAPSSQPATTGTHLQRLAGIKSILKC